MASALKLLLWTVVALFVLSLATDDAGAQVPELPSAGVKTDVAGLEVGVGASSGGIEVEASSSGPNLQASASSGGVRVEATAAGTNVQAGASSGGVRVEARAAGTNVQTGASAGGVRVEASAAGTNVQAGAPSGGVEISASGGGARSGDSLPETGRNAQAGPPNDDLAAGAARRVLNRPPAGAENASGAEPESAIDEASGAQPSAEASTSVPRAERPEGALVGFSGVTQPASSVLLDAATIGVGPGNNAPPAPTTSTPAATPSGGSWNLGGSLHAVLTAALLLVALGLLYGVRGGSWKPPLEPLRLLASPG